MATRNPTHYEVLGLDPSAKHTEVGLAYNRKLAAHRREDAPPDPQGVARLKEAFEVLSDLDRRAEYDAMLRAAMMKPAFRKGQGLVAAGFLVLVGAGLYWHLRPQEAPPAPGKTYDELLAAATPAIGRLKATEMSGQVRNAGLAFAVDEGTLVTSCAGLPANSQLLVEYPTRSVPARVAMSDPALGLCKLEVPGSGAWQLAVSDTPPRGGDRAYAAYVNTTGEVGLREIQVKNVKTSDKGTVVLTNVAPEHPGTPLIDIHGRVIAVANVTEGQGAYVPLPKSWGDAPIKESKPAAYEHERETPPQQARDARVDPAVASGLVDPAIADLQPKARMPSHVTPEQQRRLEKAFRPPPTVPDDL
jgi:hypothetical protein